MAVFDRGRLKTKPLAERLSKTPISRLVSPEAEPPKLQLQDYTRLENIAVAVKQAREKDAPVIFAFGAHLVKNGLSPVMIELMKQGYVQHLLGCGAVVIHDWEFAYHGETEEDVEHYLEQGQFGIWDETGKYINRAVKQGCKQGFGAAVGKMISEEKLAGESIPHPNRDKSVLGEAYRLGIPASICAGIGHDIFFTHPECDGAAIGEASYADFLKLAESVSKLEDGVYISIGSATTSPMVFEKALSMAKNAALQEGRKLENYRIVVNDIQPSPWDWSKGEPPKDNPAYYLRFFKTFSRMGGTCEYVQMDNRAFLHNLYHMLEKRRH